MAGYHKYVFDVPRRCFVGEFERMYAAEETEGFDSWLERDLRPLRKAISYTILNGYTFQRILEIGCGKGTFTHLLKKKNNYVLGIDISPTAIRRAIESFPDIDFRQMPVSDLASLNETFDLAAVVGTFAYIEDWPEVLKTLSGMTHWIYVAEYIPPNPIGFVKSSQQLIGEVRRYFEIETKVLLDDEHCLLLAHVPENGSST